MAFNPFSAFRRYKKVMLAGLAIMAMFSFILCSGVAGAGRDDLFSLVMGFFGAKSRQGEVVTTLYGDKVYSSQLNETTYHRQIANDFFKASLERGRQALHEEMRKEVLKKLSPESFTEDRIGFMMSVREAFFEDVGFGRVRGLSQEDFQSIRRDPQFDMVQDNLMRSLTEPGRRVQDLTQRQRILARLQRRLAEKGL